MCSLKITGFSRWFVFSFFLLQSSALALPLAAQPLQSSPQTETEAVPLPPLTVNWNSFDWLLKEIESESEKSAKASKELLTELYSLRAEVRELNFSQIASDALRMDLEASLKKEREERAAKELLLQAKIDRQDRDIRILKAAAWAGGIATLIFGVIGIIGWVL